MCKYRRIAERGGARKVGKVRGWKSSPDASDESYNRSIYFARFQAEYISSFPFLILFCSLYIRATDNTTRHEGTGAAFCRSRNDFMTVASLSPSPAVNPTRRRVEEANAKVAGGRTGEKEDEARRSNGEREAIRWLALPRPTVLAVSAARRACMRACTRARNCTPRPAFVCMYVCACVRDVVARVCAQRGREEERAVRASERAAGAADSLCPRKLCNRTAHDSTSSLPLALLLLPLPLLLLLLRSSIHRSPHALRAPAASASLLDPRCDRISLIRSLLLPRSFLLLVALPNPYPSRASTTSLPPSLCHSIAAESSQPDAGTARGRNDPRARQGRAEGVIRSSPYVHRAAPGIRIIKLRDSLLSPPPPSPTLPTTPRVSWYRDLASDNGPDTRWRPRCNPCVWRAFEGSLKGFSGRGEGRSACNPPNVYFYTRSRDFFRGNSKPRRCKVSPTRDFPRVRDSRKYSSMKHKF